MKNKNVLMVGIILLLAQVNLCFAVPPECKDPGAPPSCFVKTKSKVVSSLKYKLVPIDVCDQAPIFDPETGRITYPCGLGIAPNKPPQHAPFDGASVRSTTTKPAKVKIQPILTKYMGSTIHDNEDGTSSIDHGGSATETINTSDAARIVKEYKDNQGITIIVK